MDADQKPVPTKTTPKPSPQEVLCLQALFPRLDYLMCETLLMQSEDDLEKYLRPAPTAGPEEK